MKIMNTGLSNYQDRTRKFGYLRSFFHFLKETFELQYFEEGKRNLKLLKIDLIFKKSLFRIDFKKPYMSQNVAKGRVTLTNQLLHADTEVCTSSILVFMSVNDQISVI